eukprot:GFUD01032473.1.p1 GENE.GFUD01032473.1~~GFUD01032473.1.p1  ORF type:complete len:341 (+),score=87.31 GFUD01032473.1:102-1124(+)
MSGQVQLETQFEVPQFQTSQFEAPQFYYIQADGPDTTQHTEYVVRDLGDLGDNAIIMFEEGGVGAEEIVSSEEYVTYTVPSRAVNLSREVNLSQKSEYDLLGAHYSSEVSYQPTAGGNSVAKLEIRDAIANIGVVDCQEEEVHTEYKTGFVHHVDGDVHYEIKSEVLEYDDVVPSNKAFFTNGSDPVSTTKVYKQISEQPLNLVKKERITTNSASLFEGNSDLVICKLCNSYVVGSKIDIHNRDIHSNMNCLNCPDCGKLFTSKRSLVGHKKEKHSGQLEIFPCSECGKNFSRKSNLKAHMDSIHFGKKFPCSFCDRIFTNRSCMNLHVKKTHSDIMMSL